MLQQILNDMYIEPELLAELDEEQKQILFCKMREEQVRRWRESEERLQREEDKLNDRKKKDGGKKVTFLVGVDGEPMVVVLGGEGGAQREDVDSILEERAKQQADLEADMLKRAAEEELDKLVRLSRSTVEAMEEEATRTSTSKVRDPAREAVVRSLQEATVEMEGQIQALEEAEAYQRKLSNSSSSSSSGASSPSSPSPSSSSSTSSSSSGIGSIGTPRQALSSSPSTSSLSSLSSFTSSQPPSPPAFTISTYGSPPHSTARRPGGGSGASMWEAVNKASHPPSSTSSTSSVLSPANFSSVVKPPILTPKPTAVSPPQPLRASQPSVSPPSSLSSTTSTFSSSSSTSSSSALPTSSVVETSLASPSASSVVGVAAQIRRFEQLSEGSLEALKTATLERAKKRREREIFEHLRSQVEAARQQAASVDLEAASRQQQAAEKDDIAWQEQERKAKEAERRIREIARRAREEHRRATQNTPPSSPPASALNYNLNGLTRLTNGINRATHAPSTPPGGDINGNVNSVADDISNNNDSMSLKKYSSSSSRSSLGSPGIDGLCFRQRLRPPKPPSRAAIITWFRDEELLRGAGLDPSCSHIAPWFHGIISRTEAEEVLSEVGIGCFLVRVSERIWGYAISYRAPDRCRHYLIDVTGGKYTFFGSHQASHDSLRRITRRCVTAAPPLPCHLPASLSYLLPGLQHTPPAMFSSGPNYTKLKTNLRLSINRLKLLEKKKTELAQKARKEIADYLSTGKTERAKIRVEHIIREDYLVEAMEVTEMYCDLLLARYGLIQQMKDLDEGMAEAVSSLIWAAPRLQTDVAELKIIADQLTLKFGKPYGQACREQQVTTISERLIHKLSVQAPPKVLVEKYLVEIAKNYNVEYEPDPQVMREDEWGNDPLISLDEKNNLGNGGAGGGGGGGGGMNIPPMAGFIGYPPQPMPQQPFTYPGSGGAGAMDLNLPNVPGQPIHPQPGMPMGGYNIPPGGPPPADASADPLPEKISNMQNITGSGQWSDPMGMENSPPPEYSSFLPSGHHATPVPNAPYPSMPYAGQPSARPPFPPDVGAKGDNLKDGEQPKPAPRSKFGEGDGEFTMPDLPSVPDLPGTATLPDPSDAKDDIDFDDLTKRFEDLKKKK